MYFLLWSTALFLHSLGVPIVVVHVGSFWFWGVGIHVGSLEHNFERRGQRFLSDDIFNLVLFHSKGHRSNQHPQRDVFNRFYENGLNDAFQRI